MMPLISVIIPIYNVANYLSASLESVVNQTYTNIEIILVNDGSTDNSVDIIKEFAAKDLRIVVVDKKNEGVVIARKAGLSIAIGEYIHYLDGDDYLDVDAYEILNTYISKDKSCDAFLLPFRFIESATKAEVSIRSYSRDTYSNIEYLIEAFENQYYSVWQYILKRSIYQKNIQYDSSLTFGEDAFLTSQLIYHCKKIIRIKDKPLLFYVQRETSVSNKKYSATTLESIYCYPHRILDFMRDKPEYEYLLPHLSSVRLQAYSLLISNGYLKHIKHMSKDAAQCIKLFPTLKANIEIARFSKLYTVYNLNSILGRMLIARYKSKKKIK